MNEEDFWSVDKSRDATLIDKMKIEKQRKK